MLNSTDVYISWLPPEQSLQNGVIQKYIVSVYEISIDDALEETDVLDGTSIVITDLHPYYNYQVTVSAFTIGPGPYSDVMFTMDEDGNKFKR